MQDMTGLKLLKDLDVMLEAVTSFINYDSQRSLHVSDLLLLDLIDEKLRILSIYTGTLRNSAAHINRLPAEILGSIVHCAIGTTPSYEYMQQLLSITHVCRHWRELCLALPLLWARILADTWKCETLSLLSLRRSRPAPLDVIVDRVSWQPDSIFREVTSHIGRIARLQIGVDYSDALNAFSYLQVPAPTLQQLAIDTRPARTSRDALYLPRLFGGETPCLKRLTLCAFNMVAENQFANLRELVLCRQQYSSPSELNSLVNLLRASPALASLSFQCVFFASSPLGPIQRVELPHLRRLVCESCGLTDARSILSILDVPQEAALRLSIDLSQETGNTHMQPLVLPNSGTITKLCTRVLRSESITTGTGDASSFSLSLQGTHAQNERHALTHAICEEMPLDRIEDLWLLGDLSRTTATWDQSLHKLTALSRLVIDLQTRSRLLECLIPDADDTTQFLPCPRLAELALVDVQWAIWETLRAVLERRHRQGSPVRTLVIYTYDRSCSSVELNAESERWKSFARALHPFVENISFKEFIELPSIPLPGACQRALTDQGHYL